jgi:hypothetical protein
VRCKRPLPRKANRRRKMIEGNFVKRLVLLEQYDNYYSKEEENSISVLMEELK